MATKINSATKAMVKSDFEALAEFRYRLRLFLRFSEDACNASGITPLQYQLLLQTKGFPGRQWASSSTDLRQVEIHLAAKGEKLVEQLARLHRAELVTLPDFVAMPVLAPIQPQ